MCCMCNTWYSRAEKSARGESDYLKTNHASEDFAEAIAMYSDPKQRAVLKKNYPKKFREVELKD